MTGRRAIVGLCMLCALAFSAFAAQSAAAATNGTTGWTCKKTVGTGTFKTDHCKTVDGAGTEYSHVEWPEKTPTDLLLTNAKTNATTTGPTVTKLHSVISGIETELQATGVLGEGEGENMKDAVTGEHTTAGSGTIHYSGVTVLKPAGKGCVVHKTKEGEVEKVDTNPLKATTAGQGMFLKFEPSEGTVFSVFWIEGCSIAALNGEYQVKGSVKGEPDGATTVFTRAGTTEQGTLTLRGQKAGIDGKVTISGKDTAAGDKEFTPLAATTKETP